MNRTALDPIPYPAWRIGMVIGFATTVVMWLIAFFMHLQGLTAEPWVTGVALLFAQFGGSILAGRFASQGRSAWKLGLSTGLTIGILNLLILGSVLTEPARTHADEALRPNAGMMVAGYLFLSLSVGLLGSVIGSRLLSPKIDQPDQDHDRWVTRFAWVAAFAVVPVLFTGGLTTSNQAGLAVPDWPNTYATNMFLYPVSSMTGGKLYEHTHRLFGSLAGVAALGLFLYSCSAWIGARRAGSERRSFYGLASALSLAAGLAVLTQGIIGGYRVILADGADETERWTSEVQAIATEEITRSFSTTTDNTTSLGLAVVHGMTGQLTFALLCIIATVLSLRWLKSSAEQRTPDFMFRFASAGLAITLILQLSLGSVTRHFQHTHALFAHMGFSVIVTGFAIFAAARGITKHAQSRPIAPIAKGVLAVVLTQFLLGWVALMVVVPHYDEALGTTPTTAERPAASVLVATMHQMTGAALLALAVLLAFWAYRLTAPGHATSTAREPLLA